MLAGCDIYDDTVDTNSTNGASYLKIMKDLDFNELEKTRFGIQSFSTSGSNRKYVIILGNNKIFF